MLLVTVRYTAFDGSDVVLHVSNEYGTIAGIFYDAKVSGISSVKYATNSEYGGYVLISIGSIEFLPDTLHETWPPPTQIGLEFQFSNEEGTEVKDLFHATGHLNSLERTRLLYDIYMNKPSYAVSSTKIEGTLYEIFEQLAGMFDPDYALDATYAPNSNNINVSVVTPSSETLLIDVFADIAVYYGHFFYIDDFTNTIHLVDVNVSNGDVKTITEFDFMPSKYVTPIPIRKISVGEAFTYGNYSYGREISLNNICASTASLKFIERCWLVANCMTGDDIYIPYDPNKLYRYTVKYKKRDINDFAYFGFACMSALNTPINIVGDADYYSQHYICSSNGATVDSEYSITGYISGHATTGTENIGLYGTGIDDRLVAVNGTNYIRPLIYNEHTSTDVYYVAIHEIAFNPDDGTSSGEVLETLFEYKADYFDPTEWEAVVGDIANVSNSAQNAIDHVLSVSNKSNVELHMPLTYDNILNIGQGVEWVDNSLPHPIDVSMQVREINYEFNNHEIVLVCDGAIT
jgi:hypothetical protein